MSGRDSGPPDPLDLAHNAFAILSEIKDYALYLLDPSGRILTWNSGAQAIKGYTADEVIGQSFSLFFSPQDRAAGRPQRLLGRAATEGRTQDEGWRVRKDGSSFWADVVLTAIHDPATGALRGFAKVTRDLTERRRMEEEARAAAAQAALERARTEQARTQLHARDEFISVAAHELRTPLTALLIKLQGAAELLRKASDAPDSASQARLAGRLDTALHQIQRLTELVERLLDVSRIVSGKLEVTLDEVDLEAIVRHVVDDLSEAARAAGSEVRLNACGEARGLWDSTRIEQVVTNLLANAIKYGGGKPIDVELRATDESATIVVQDRGIGIAADAMDRIFTRFERAAPVRNYGGLGLGLYVARNIVDAHGGSIRVSSEPGQGSTFMVDLPLRPAGAPPGARAETQP